MRKSKLATLFEEIFQISLAGYLIFLLAETLKEGFVTNFFNLNILLGVVLVSGIGMSIFAKPREEKTKKVITETDWLISFGFALLTGVIIYYKTRDLNSISIVIAAVSSLLVFLLSYLLLSDSDTA